MKINEIFYSIQGESTYAGFPCVFVRLTGCNLRCHYCDTQYAYFAGEKLSLDEIEERVLRYHCQLVEITGGEPLLQSETPLLAQRLAQKKRLVLIETNGTFDIRVIQPPVIRIIDIKCPGSGESDKVYWQNLSYLRQDDELKFVISDRQDFEWAVAIIQQYDLLQKVCVLFSPAHHILNPASLAEWLLDSHLKIRLQVQLHKYLSVK